MVLELEPSAKPFCGGIGNESAPWLRLALDPAGDIDCLAKNGVVEPVFADYAAEDGTGVQPYSDLHVFRIRNRHLP